MGAHVILSSLTRTDGGIGAVVLAALSRVADVELLSGREDGLEKEVSVVISCERSPGRGCLAMQIEVGGLRLPGKELPSMPMRQITVNGNAPHGQHGAEGDPAGDEAVAEAFPFQMLFQMPLDDP